MSGTRSRSCELSPAVFALGALLAAPLLGAGLNDTGQTSCFDLNGNVQPCSLGRQDARYGRDAAVAAGALPPKTGAGMAGFDFTKIANDGTVLPASASLGGNPADWACTRDNVTGLTWEVKTAGPADLRYSGHQYTWYSTAANNGGDPGDVGGDTCGGTLAAYANECNTTNFVAAVNAATLCGRADWRLPTIRELESIRQFGPDDPAIDPGYFPNTASSFYWSGSTNPLPIGPLLVPDAWVVYFRGGASGSQSTGSAPKNSGGSLRLVRSAP